MTSSEIKKKFFEHFKARDHLEIPNSSLVPEYDPTLLFINSGMAPIKKYFLGLQKPPSERLFNVQRCLRTEDLDQVGKNTKTLTFFEMMGSWSIGGYGKQEAVEFALDLITQGYGFKKERLYATVFAGDKDIPRDEETIRCWLHVGIPKERVLLLPASENFWTSGPVGPCGPCTEVLYDRGASFATKKDSRPETDGDRFYEIWNAGVFMEYNKLGEGKYEPLPFKSVDTGAGVERFATILQGKSSIFEIDLIWPLIKVLEKIASRSYEKDEKDDLSFRIISDHTRAMTFAIADDVFPSNTGRGYVLRRLIRRAIRQAYLLDINGYFLSQVADVVIEIMAGEYPKLLNNKANILKVIEDEEERFGKTLKKGIKLLDKLLAEEDLKKISGEVAFKLYDTYGFPLDLTQEIAGERGVGVDVLGFKRELKKQQKRSREAGEFKKKAMAALSSEVAKNHTATHLLNEALRRVVDPNIKQAGQDLTAERLRFDFTFDRALTAEEIEKVEEEVNKLIEADLKVMVKETTFEQAKKEGAQALFAEKYKAVDRVTLYKVGDYSKELCGGPHVKRTGEIKSFKIIKQEAVGRGVRRIRAAAK